MATFHVTTAAQLKAAFDAYVTLPEPVIIEIDADIDYNDSDYYRYDNDFLYLGENNQPFTINGNGHTLSNIFLFPNRALIRYFTYTGVLAKVNDLKIEAITNNGAILRHNQYYSYQGERYGLWLFTNCTFNVKLYSMTNGLFQFFTPGSGNADTVGFVNCIFNLYISGISTDQSGKTLSGTNSNPTIYDAFFWPIIEIRHYNYYYSWAGTFIVSGCMFNIRNTTDKFFMLCRPQGNANNIRVVIDNNAIFYSDIGEVQPTYVQTLEGTGDDGTGLRQHKILPSASVASYQNNYIAQFDQYMSLNPDFIKPVFEIFNGSTGADLASVTSILNTSFYDKDKIRAVQFYNISYSWLQYHCNEVSDLNSVLTALTTEECKDPVKLGAAGYIFAQEA